MSTGNDLGVCMKVRATDAFFLLASTVRRGHMVSDIVGDVRTADLF